MYPLCLNVKEQLCVVVGGGMVAERKILSLLEAGAKVRIVSPQLTAVLGQLAAEGRIEWLSRNYQQGDLAGALLVFAATNSRNVQDAVVQDARQANQLVNAADAPSLCSFHVPATVRRGDLIIAVSTCGKSPALAAAVKRQLEKSYGQEYAVLLELMAQIREQALVAEGNCRQRKILFQNILHEDILQWTRDGQWELLRSHLRTILGPNADVDLSQMEKDL